MHPVCTMSQHGGSTISPPINATDSVTPRLVFQGTRECVSPGCFPAAAAVAADCVSTSAHAHMQREALHNIDNKGVVSTDDSLPPWLCS